MKCNCSFVNQLSSTSRCYALKSVQNSIHSVLYQVFLFIFGNFVCHFVVTFLSPWLIPSPLQLVFLGKLKGEIPIAPSSLSSCNPPLSNYPEIPTRDSREETRGGYSHNFTIRVYAAVQGMVFKPLSRTGYRKQAFLVRNRMSNLGEFRTKGFAKAQFQNRRNNG